MCLLAGPPPTCGRPLAPRPVTRAALACRPLPDACALLPVRGVLGASNEVAPHRGRPRTNHGGLRALCGVAPWKVPSTLSGPGPSIKAASRSVLVSDAADAKGSWPIGAASLRKDARTTTAGPDAGRPPCHPLADVLRGRCWTVGEDVLPG